MGVGLGAKVTRYTSSLEKAFNSRALVKSPFSTDADNLPVGSSHDVQCPDLDEDAMFHRNGQQERRLYIVAEYFEEFDVVSGLISLGRRHRPADGRLGAQPRRNAIQEVVEAVGFVQRVERLHGVEEGEVADEASAMRRLRPFHDGASRTSRRRRRRQGEEEARGGIGVEDDELSEAFRDMSLVELDDEVGVGAESITEENQEGDRLFVDVDGALADQPLDHHVLTNGAKTIEHKVVRVHREKAFLPNRGGYREEE